VGLVAHVGEMRNEYRSLVRKPKGRDHSEELCLGGKIILKWIIKG
jgi:hypothetical protein